MFETLAQGASHPAVAAWLGLGTAAVAAVVVAMAWSVNARQIRLAELLVRRQFPVISGNGAAKEGAAEIEGAPAPEEVAVGREGAGGKEGAAGKQGASRAKSAAAGGQEGPAAAGGRAGSGAAGGRSGNGGHAGPAGGGHAGPAAGGGHAGPAAGGGHAGTAAGGGHAGRVPPEVIEGPDEVVAGEQARFRVQSAGPHQVVSWAVGGGAVSHAPDPAHPSDLLLLADQPGDLTIIARVREGLTERRATKTVTAVAEVAEPRPPFTLRLFLHGWGLVVVAVLIVGFAGALNALGNFTSSDFIAVAVPLAALLGVLAVARGAAEAGGRPGNGHGHGTGGSWRGWRD
jgi:hypothetical protein